MNPLPIEKARDPDLRLSPDAMQRAAQRARELARRTDTRLVFGRDGTVEHVHPSLPALPLPAASSLG